MINYFWLLDKHSWLCAPKITTAITRLRKLPQHLIQIITLTLLWVQVQKSLSDNKCTNVLLPCHPPENEVVGTWSLTIIAVFVIAWPSHAHLVSPLWSRRKKLLSECPIGGQKRSCTLEWWKWKWMACSSCKLTISLSSLTLNRLFECGVWLLFLITSGKAFGISFTHLNIVLHQIICPSDTRECHSHHHHYFGSQCLGSVFEVRLCVDFLLEWFACWKR
jgi:hypothetical protein